MKIRNLLYLLLALPLVFAACEPDNPDTDKPVVKDPVLTLTSNATLEFAADGGAGEITYTLENAKEGVEVMAECAAEWVTNVTVAEKVTFDVEANEGDAPRNATIVVKYDTQKFEVAVKQAAKGVVEKTYDEEFEFVLAGRLLFPGVDMPENLFMVVLSNEDETDELLITLLGQEGDTKLQAGTYSAADENVVLESSVFSVNDSETTYELEDVVANVAVEGDIYSFDVDLTTVDGKCFRVTYEGELTDVTIDFGGDEYEMDSATRLGTADLGFEVYSYDFPVLFESDDLSALIYFVGKQSDKVLQAGEYGFEDYSILPACTQAVDALGNEIDLEDAYAYVEENDGVYSIEVELVSSEGDVYYFTYDGEIEGMNPSDKEPEFFAPVKVTAELWAEGNFLLQLYVDEYRYHELDMYDNVNPNGYYLSAGQYKMSDGTIGDWSTYSNGVNTTCTLTDAEITLLNNADNTVTLIGYIRSAEGHYITIVWTGNVDGFKFGGADGEKVTFEAKYFTYEHYDYGGVYNYYITLSDAANEDVADASYYHFDLYSETLDTDNPRVPVGVYEFDIEDSCADGTMGVSYTFMSMTTSEGISVWLQSKGGTLTVTETGVEAVINFDDGSTHTITYTGDLSIELPEEPEPEPVTTLTEDLTLNVTGATVVSAVCQGAMAEGAYYWEIVLMEDMTYGCGAYMQLGVISSSDESYFGTYTSAMDYSPNSFYPGVVGDWGKVCSWYFNQNYYSTTAWAPLSTGTITIVKNSDGSKSFNFDCTDGYGHAIAGTITAN